jgi:hypothetical protein
MGVRFPLPAPSNLLIYNSLRLVGRLWESLGVQLLYSAYPVYLQCFSNAMYFAFSSTLYIASWLTLRQITECAADKWSAKDDLNPRSFKSASERSNELRQDTDSVPASKQLALKEEQEAAGIDLAKGDVALRYTPILRQIPREIMSG